MKQKDNYDIPTNIMIGDSEDGSKGLSRELKNKLLEYKTKLDELVLPADKSKISIGINVNDPKITEEHNTWEMYNFYHSPLAAVITILSKIKSDVKNSEAVIVDYLLTSAAGDVIPFDTVAPKIIPQSNYVLLGDEYKAEVFVAAFSKTKNPKIYADILNNDNQPNDNSLDSLSVNKGIGNYNYKPTREGIFKWGGKITVQSSSGKEITYPFQSEYIVARPSINVSADYMNVFYVGLENPITVSVPGVPTERITASINNGSLAIKGTGKYNAMPKTAGKALVTLTATLENGEKRNMGTVEYRVKNLPKPLASFGGKTVGGKMKLDAIKSQQGVMAVYDPSFEYAVKPKIISYKLSMFHAGAWTDSNISNGAYFSEDMKKIIKSLKRGDKLLITEIKAVGADQITHPISEMAIQVD